MQKWSTVPYLLHLLAKYSTLRILSLLCCWLPLTAHTSNCNPVLCLHLNSFGHIAS